MFGWRPYHGLNGISTMGDIFQQKKELKYFCICTYVIITSWHCRHAPVDLHLHDCRCPGTKYATGYQQSPCWVGCGNDIIWTILCHYNHDNMALLPLNKRGSRVPAKGRQPIVFFVIDWFAMAAMGNDATTTSGYCWYYTKVMCNIISMMLCFK